MDGGVEMANLSNKYKDSLPFESSNVNTITSNYAALDNDVVFVNTASSALTVTLPASPTPGSKIKVLDVAENAQNNIITILGNGRNIGGASAYIINTPDSSAEFLFINNAKGWNVLNEYISITKPLSPTGISAVDVGTGRAYNNGAATVTFTPSVAGDAATSYTVTSTPGSYSATGTSSPIIVTGLQSGVSYTFKVFGSNPAGNSAESTSSSSITATTVPQAPTLTSVTFGYQRLIASFTTNETGGKAISSFTTTPFGADATVGSSPVTLSNLTGGTSYAVTTTATNANGTSLASNSISEVPFSATGGTVTTYSNYRVHTFNSTADFVTTRQNTIEYLVVAGGGGGGYGGGDSGAGGAGAGGFLEGSTSLSPNTYNIQIGGGGGATAKGSNSVFHTITSEGGGLGGSGSGGAGGGNGGSGGGANGIATSGQGFNGGAGQRGGEQGGRGGGGAGGSPGPNGSFSSGSEGGASKNNSLQTGSAIAYAGGGGGGNGYAPPNGGGLGGPGGGAGAGGSNTSASIANRGSAGGGGNGFGGGPRGGGSGSSGVVILRYAI
jgi:hypothetical protein